MEDDDNIECVKESSDNKRDNISMTQRTLTAFSNKKPNNCLDSILQRFFESYNGKDTNDGMIVSSILDDNSKGKFGKAYQLIPDETDPITKCFWLTPIVCLMT